MGGVRGGNGRRKGALTVLNETSPTLVSCTCIHDRLQSQNGTIRMETAHHLIK